MSGPTRRVQTQKSGSNKKRLHIVAKRSLTTRPLPLFDLVDCRIHGVANAAPGRAGQGLERAGIGLQGQLEHVVARSELVRHLTPSELRRACHLAVQPLGHRVARQPRHPRNLALRLVLAAMQLPNPANYFLGDHSSSDAAQKCSKSGGSPGSVLGRRQDRLPPQNFNAGAGDARPLRRASRASRASRSFGHQ